MVGVCLPFGLPILGPAVFAPILDHFPIVLRLRSDNESSPLPSYQSMARDFRLPPYPFPTTFLLRSVSIRCHYLRHFGFLSSSSFPLPSPPSELLTSSALNCFGLVRIRPTRSKIVGELNLGPEIIQYHWAMHSLKEVQIGTIFVKYEVDHTI